MNEFCIFCHDREDLTDWVHPISKEEYKICDHCKQNLIGPCQNCGEMVFKTEYFGYNESGYVICAKCVHLAELSEDKCSR